MYSPHLQRALSCFFHPADSLFIFRAHTFATLALLSLSVQCLSLYLSLSSLTLSLTLGHWSVWLSHCSPLSSLLQNPPPSTLFSLLPDLSFLCFASASGLLKNIKTKSRHFSFCLRLASVSFLFSLSACLSALQIIQSGRLLGYTKPSPARCHS